MSEDPDKKENKPVVPPPLREPVKGKDGEQPSPMKSFLPLLLIVMLIIMMFQIYANKQNAGKEISFTPDFVDYIRDGRITKCEIVIEASRISFIRGEIEPDNLVPAAEDTAGTTKPVKRKFTVNVPTGDKLEELLDLNDVDYKYVYQSDYMMQLITGVVPVLLVFGLLYFLFMRQMRNASGSALGFGKSRAKMLNREKQKITFDNVAGIDEAKEEVQEIIEFLKDPKRFTTLGGRIPKGVLLMGPPGTGKTLLAKAIAGEADVPFFSISGSDFVEMFVGVGASRVRDMFEQGKKSAPCIIFIDEIDAVGRSRFTGIGGGHDEREQTLNALLVEMDGFDTQEGVIILAATNRPDVLDEALLRPGRFDRQIIIDLPLIDGRAAILEMHARQIKLAEGVDLRRIARGTPGFSGADLENLLNEAALLAARENKTGVENSDLEEARDKVKWGRERRSRKMDSKEKKLTAYHEAGHALVQQFLEESEPLHKVTIIPRGMYLGATMSLPDKDRYTEGRNKLKGDLAMLMGGRIAEDHVFGEITTGASNDLKVATAIARRMICSWGMSETLGPQTFGENEELMFLGREISRSQNYSEDTARKIDAEISQLLMESYKKAEAIITEHRDKLDMIVERLLELETIDGRDVEEIVKHHRILSAAERDEVDKKKQEEEKAKEPVAETVKEPVSSDVSEPSSAEENGKPLDCE